MFGDLRIYNIYPFETHEIHIDYEDLNNFLADGTIHDGKGNTVLHQYVTKHKFNREEMQSLIAKENNLDFRNDTGKTAFLLAVVHRQKEMIETFIENGADVNTADKMGNNALHYLALPDLNSYWVYEAAFFRGDNTLALLGSDERVLFDDTCFIMKRLLNSHVAVNCMNYRQETPLMWAARGNHVDIVAALLAFGANVHLRNENMETCLHLASAFNPDDPLNKKRWDEENHAILSELVRHKACVNCLDGTNRTPLGNINMSCHQNKFPFTWELIKMAALVNWRKKIEFYLSAKRVLGSRESESLFIIWVNSFYAEIGRMNAYQLPGESNLSQFARRGVSEKEKSREYEITDAVLEIILTENFPLYNNLFFSRLERNCLREKVSKMAVYLREESGVVGLDGASVHKLSSFLENIDIFNLISAFHRPTSQVLKRNLEETMDVE